MLIKRFNRVQRLFHLFLVVTFLMQSGTGFGRVYITTEFGRTLCSLFGGYETAIIIHFWTGVAMMIGFTIHVLYLLKKIHRRDLINSVMAKLG